MLLFVVGNRAVLFIWNVEHLTDILVQQFKKSFELSQFSAQLAQTASFLGYFCMAIPPALIMRRWGCKTGMVMGLTLFGGGMVLFWPARFYCGKPFSTCSGVRKPWRPKVVEAMGITLGRALAFLVNILNLPLYLIGGGVASAWPLFSEW